MEIFRQLSSEIDLRIGIEKINRTLILQIKKIMGLGFMNSRQGNSFGACQNGV